MYDVTEALSEVPMFSACTKKELKLIARLGERVAVREGTALVNEGRRGHEFYVLLDGKAEVLRGNSQVAVLGPGEHFGELALLDPAPRSATVRMTTDGEVLEITQPSFYELIEDVPILARRLLAGLARRLHDLDGIKA
jgi:CRP-like cAMP-binding protein